MGARRFFCQASGLRNYGLVLIGVTVLIGLSLINLWDFKPVQSFVLENWKSGDPFFLVKRQLLWVGLGMIAMLAIRPLLTAGTRFFWLIAFAVPLLQLLTLAPLTGKAIHGSQRYFDFFGLNVYAGIWVVLLSIPLVSMWLSKINRHRLTRWPGLGLGCWLLLVNALFLRQPDLPMLALFDAVVLGMAVFSRNEKSSRLKVIAAAPLGLLLIFAFGFYNHHYTVSRLMKSVAACHSDPFGQGYQARIALEDIGSGGFFGQGLGSFSDEKRQRHHYIMPQTITTYMLQITARQLGLAGILIVCLGSGGIIMWGWRQSRREPEDFEHLLKTGAVLFLAIQAFCGITRTLNIIPFSPAHAIPFLAYGAHKTMASFAALGILGGMSAGKKENTLSAHRDSGIPERDSGNPLQ